MQVVTQFVSTHARALAIALVGCGMMYAAAPAKADGCYVRVWCEPVYRDVTWRVYHAPVTRCVVEAVCIAAYYECGRCIPAHVEYRRREIVVTPGFYDLVTERRLVRAGHYEYVHD